MTKMFGNLNNINDDDDDDAVNVVYVERKCKLDLTQSNDIFVIILSNSNLKKTLML